jgi:ribose transport system ATP-binding protein
MLHLENIHKAFGPVRALRGVNLTVQPGEVHGLIGENGAGKSTLMKVLSGVHQPDEGRMTFDGQPFAPSSPLEGRAAGVSMIYQELILAPHLTVEENITLGLEQARYGWIHPQTDRVRAVLDELGQAGIDPRTPVHRLSIGKQQLVEIGRALLAEARVVVMDEPTSSLSAADTQALFQVIRRLKEKGVAVIYISHFLEEVQQVCDRYTVLRDGETVATGDVAGTDAADLIEHMVGRSVDELYPQSTHALGETVLEVAGLSGAGQAPASVSFALRRGEILGLFGLVGSGRSETLRALFGLHRAEGGTMTLQGQPDLKAAWISPPDALDRGLDLLSENRKEEGLALNLSLLTNLTLSGLRRYSRFGFVNLRREAAQGRAWIDRLRVRCHSATQPALSLSGGNQQKVCLARLLHHDSDILFLDEPTRGIDIGSKAEIYRLIHALAAQGKAIVMVSSYLPELFGICDTLAVMHKGRLSEAQPVSGWTDLGIMRLATSG